MKKLWNILLIIALLSFSLGEQEYASKLGFIVKVARFVKWETPSTNSTINCYKDFVFKKPVEKEINKGSKINGKLISSQLISTDDKLNTSTFLFVPKSQKSELKNILKSTANSNVLVISEQKNGAQMGAIFNLILENSKLTFEVNKTEAKKKGISINSKILQLAKKVF